MKGKSNKRWKMSEESKLIDMLDEYYDLFLSSKKVAFFRLLQSEFPRFSYIQIKNKMYKMRLRYLTIKKLGYKTYDCKFFSRLDSIFSRYPLILELALKNHKIKRISSNLSNRNINKLNLEFILN